MIYQKGITPVVAILVLLLITIAITGSAWIYISTYYGGITSEAVEITSADCDGKGVQIFLRNIGSGNLNLDEVTVTRLNISGSCWNDTINLSYANNIVIPGGAGKISDTHCNSTDNVALQYTIIAGGRVQKVNINC
jgi:flagellin-like protein